MDIKDVIDDLKSILPEKVDYADLVGAEGFAYGYTYVYEDPEPYFIENAIKTIERLASENKDLRNDLIMQTALAKNIQNSYEYNQLLARQYEALLKDVKKIIVKCDDVCEYCKHHKPCFSKKCECYVEGRGAEDQNGYMHDWEWSCEDFDFGTCPKLENTPCNGCIRNNMKGFEWRGAI